VENFDEIISPNDVDLKASGLLDVSLIRLGFLALMPPDEFLGDIGSISIQRHRRLLRRLADYLSEPPRKK
jgi:mRNA interferase MazF